MHVKIPCHARALAYDEDIGCGHIEVVHERRTQGLFGTMGDGKDSPLWSIIVPPNS